MEPNEVEGGDPPSVTVHFQDNFPWIPTDQTWKAHLRLRTAPGVKVRKRMLLNADAPIDKLLPKRRKPQPLTQGKYHAKYHAWLFD